MVLMTVTRSDGVVVTKPIRSRLKVRVPLSLVPRNIMKKIKYIATYGVSEFIGRKKVKEKHFKTEQAMWNYIRKQEKS
jgi:hypothetical protein